VGPILGEPVREPEGKTFAILRETRAPAVVLEPAGAGDVDAARRIVARAQELAVAAVLGLRRAVEQPEEPPHA